ncbi:SusC/RagA family TonB-linked outer membrane protein [Filimonas effusa]|uniref:SusC/RagA family TonB-linked outer membrane protein n=1 Tax=Filimonas effusa TaxID=2508721 RepID=A0A4Q1CZT3_9BACT|nr:SusC/RagA family TonB-linked outer membrane protein [Filimonas effusa]RXK80836.1 SusC/RagA family TonB-linked outer membrane protein [Filimonas effusa]
MRPIFSFMLLCFMIHVRSLSQTIDLTESNMPLELVLNQVKTQTGYSVLWNEMQLQGQALVSVRAKKLSLNAVLEQVLTPLGLTYRLIGKLIIVTGKTKVPPRDASAAPAKTSGFSISGIIINASGEPVVMASVHITGTGIQAVSDNNGRFTIYTKRQEQQVSLLISCNGYADKRIQVSDNQKVVVTLQDKIGLLQDVVVETGLFKKRKETYTGAAVSIGADELNRAGNRNLFLSLHNLNPSLNIIENNTWGSDPNYLPELQIRGNASIPNVNELSNEANTGMNTPLILVDGFETSVQRVIDMSQEQIVSVTILKDAAATAIYGSQGANGVIAIKTKLPGESNTPGKTKIAVKYNTVIQSPDISSYNMMRTRDKLSLERKAGMYSSSSSSQDIKLKNYYNFLMHDMTRGVETDWLALPLRNAIGKKLSMSFDHKGPLFSFITTLQLNDVQGVMKASSRKNLGGDVKINFQHGKWQLWTLTHWSSTNSRNTPYGSFNTYVKMNPYWAPFDDNGFPLRQLGNPEMAPTGFAVPANPLYDAALYAFNHAINYTFIQNLKLCYNLDSFFTCKAQVAANRGSESGSSLMPFTGTRRFTSNIFRESDYSYNSSCLLQYDAAVSIHYDNHKVKNRINAGLQVSVRQQSSHTDSVAVVRLLLPSIDSITTIVQRLQQGRQLVEESFERAAAFIATANYAYRNRYFADLSIRVDGNSQFGLHNRFAAFWSAGIGWNLHQEQFFRQFSAVNKFVLRFSYGLTGACRFQPYQSLKTYKYYNNAYYAWPGSRLITLGNDDLKWQQQKKYNAGMEMVLFGNNLQITGDVYQETTEGLISFISLPASGGFPGYIGNDGTISNKGLECTVDWQFLHNKSKNYSWRIAAGLTHNQNKIIAISPALEQAQQKMQLTPSTTPVRLYKQGYAVYTMWLVPSMGIDPATGKEWFRNNNGDPVSGWDGTYVQPAGRGEPKFRGSISSVFTYAGLSASLILRYRLGGQLYNQTLIGKVENAGLYYNVDARALQGRWEKPGDYAAFKSLLVTTPSYASSRFMFNETTVEAASLHVMYKASHTLSGKLGCNELSFSMTVDNIFYASDVHRERGINYPFSRQFTFSIAASL